MKKVSLFVAIALLLVAAWVMGSPYWTLYQLKQAYEAKDTDTINRYVDFPRVRQDIKAQLSPILSAKAQKMTQSPLLQALNVNLDATTLVNPMVDRAVNNTLTPTGLASLISEQLPNNDAKLLAGLAAVAMGKLDWVDILMAPNEAALQQKIYQQLISSSINTPAAPTSEPSASYCGFNCFGVDGTVRGYPLRMMLARQGLVHWQIVGLKLPLDSDAQHSAQTN